MFRIFEILKYKFRDWLLSKRSMKIEDFHRSCNPVSVSIPDENGTLKFIEEAKTDFYVENDERLVQVVRSLKTIKYLPYKMILENGRELIGADDHLVMTFVGWKHLIDLNISDQVKTDIGWSAVKNVKQLGEISEMYDLEIDDYSHSYYTNGVLSHNTTVIAIYLFWFACFNKDKNLLVASKDNSGAMDIMDRIRFAYEELPDWLKPGVKYYNRHSIEFDNGSTIRSVSTTENTGRGKSISLLMLDELAFVRTNVQTAMWSALAPTLSTGGSCIISSTPNGDSELFATLWREAVSGVSSTLPGDETEQIETQEDDFFPIDVEWNEHPDRTEAYKISMIKKIGLERWNQEYECQFLSSDPLLINTLVLSLMKSKTPLYTDKGFFFWKEPDPNKTYIIGVDVAEGVKQDFSTIQVIELETLEQIAEYRNNTVKENQLYDAIKYVLIKLNSYVEPRTGKRPTLYWSFENNSAGAALGALYYNDEKFPEYAELVNGKETRLGMRTVNKPKVEACRYFKKLVEQTRGGLTINSKMLIFELKNFIMTGAGYAAKSGATDDLICAFLIVLRVMKYLSDYDPAVFDKLYKSEGEFYEETSNDYDDPVPFVI